MSQNTSPAVMAQRSEPHDSLDFFGTPPFATRALCDVVLADQVLRNKVAWDPCCGMLDMVKPLRDYFRHVYASDIFDYGVDAAVYDFLFDHKNGADWLIMNPPFMLAEQFATHALRLAGTGVAMFVRTQFLEGAERYKKLFAKSRPSIVAAFTERVPLHKGRAVKWVWAWDNVAKIYRKKKASTATSYCWIVWLKDAPAYETEFIWIPPCRQRLEREDDYQPLGPMPEFPPGHEPAPPRVFPKPPTDQEFEEWTK